MTEFQSVNDREASLGKLDYNQKLRACVPEYNIKTIYNKDMLPFFSPRDLPNIDDAEPVQ